MLLQHVQGRLQALIDSFVFFKIINLTISGTYDKQWSLTCTNILGKLSCDCDQRGYFGPIGTAIPGAYCEGVGSWQDYDAEELEVKKQLHCMTVHQHLYFGLTTIASEVEGQGTPTVIACTLTINRCNGRRLVIYNRGPSQLFTHLWKLSRLAEVPSPWVLKHSVRRTSMTPENAASCSFGTTILAKIGCLVYNSLAKRN